MRYVKSWLSMILTISVLMGADLQAGSCENRLFTLNIESTSQRPITLRNILSDLASSCKITLLYADKLTKSKLNQEMDAVYINDFTLDELLQLLLHEHNLFYSYDETLSRLKIAYIQTRSFKIDYINVALMQTYSARDVTVGASNSQDSGSNNGQQGNGTGSGQSGNTGQNGNSGQNNSAGENSDFTSTKTLADFTFWDELKSQVDGMLQRDGDANEVNSWSMINRDGGLITVSGSFKQLTRVEEYISELERRMHKQLLLEVRILEVTFTEGQQMGIDWSKFELSLANEASSLINAGTQKLNKGGDLYSAGFNFSMEGLMNFLKKQGDVEVLSSPKVMTLNNQPALINVGDQINYKYETGQVGTVGIGTPSSSTTFSLGSVFVGLSLSIIPEITDSGHVILRINPVDSRIINALDESDGISSATASTEAQTGVRSIPPDMKVKQLTSIVKVKDGSKVLVGGLVQREKFKVDNKVPLLGDIPYLGRLFHSTTTKKIKKEFFVVIVPTIIKKDRMPTIEEENIIRRTEGAVFDNEKSTVEEKHVEVHQKISDEEEL